MISTDQIKANLNNCLMNSDFLGLPEKRQGKVRDTYTLGDNLLIITTDRLSAFDRNIALIPFKGQVLNKVSQFWFHKTIDIVRNHMIKVPDPNAMLVRKCRVIPIEFVVRGYLTGSTETSAWTLYSRGIRNICENHLPDGMRKNQQFEIPILTPTTKADVHDEPISIQEILTRGILDKDTLDKICRISLLLFKRGSTIAKENGLILVDTKYEFGLDPENNLVLIDEIHTPDSSRYWIASSLDERLSKGQEPENIDKEFIRLWFRDHCDPYKDTVLPKAPEDLIIELSRRYIKLYEMITRYEFQPDTTSPIEQRIKTNLYEEGIL